MTVMILARHGQTEWNHRFWRLKQGTCAVNVFEVEDGAFTLVSLNDTCHLRAE